MKRWRRLVSIVGLIAVLPGASGCTLSALAPTSRVVAHAPAQGADSGAPFVRNGVVATGVLTSLDGSTHGVVTVSVDSPLLRLSIDGFRTTSAAGLQLSLSPWGPSTKCLVDQHSLQLGLIAGRSLHGIPFANLAQAPDFYKTVVLGRAVGGAGASDAHGCVISPLALAPLTWTLPDPRPRMLVVDAGNRPGAAGTVTVVAGAPTAYVVADGDNLSSIADRFGISLSDLTFLNPLDDLPLQAGQHLNLSKALRGAASVPPPCIGLC